MTPSWQDVLCGAWSELAQHPAERRQFRTRRLSQTLALPGYAALRAADDAPCLLIENVVSPDDLFEVGGMRLAVVAGERAPLTILSLEDRNRIDLFTTLCADVISATEESGEESLGHFLARLAAWRQFLRERRSGISRQEAVGLLGELVVLQMLMAQNGNALRSWAGADDGLHDFQAAGKAIEIKTSLGPSSSVTISTLDQLDTNGLRQLDLMHVRLIEDPQGSSLEQLVAGIAGNIQSDTDRRHFQNALIRRGLSPADETARNLRYQLRTIAAYHVEDAFPRIARSTIPQAVIDAQYTLDIRALIQFETDSLVALQSFGEGIIA